MRFQLLMGLLSTAFLAGAAEAQQKKGDGDGVRQACREEARTSIKSKRLGREEIKEMRRQYARDCRGKAKAS